MIAVVEPIAVIQLLPPSSTAVGEDRGNLLAERSRQRALLRAARVANALGDSARAAACYREVEPLLRETARPVRPGAGQQGWRILVSMSGFLKP